MYYNNILVDIQMVQHNYYYQLMNLYNYYLVQQLHEHYMIIEYHHRLSIPGYYQQQIKHIKLKTNHDNKNRLKENH